MIYQASDASVHNAIANHPEVFPTLSYSTDAADFTALFDEPEHYTLLHDGNGAAAIFEWSSPYVWQGHSLYLPERRGKEGVQSGKDMIAWMFDHGAKMIWGQTPLDNRPAQMFNRLIGAKTAGTGVHHVAGPVQYFIFER